ncbi:MAG: GMP synthase-like glutamine amidotransferase [Candidatus Nitrosomirales archaeon]|jgi:GMP synthase-like glutamine amidotransferase
MFEKDDFVIDRLIPVDADRLPNTIDGYNALIILGGPASVYENHQYLKDEQKLIQDAMAGKIPTLGICLGSQLLAKAAGAKVYKGSRKEIGWYPVEITTDGMNDMFKGLKNNITVFQWHGDTYDLPKNAVTLARSELYPVQAFKIGNAVGVQFHLEVSKDMVMDWINQYKSELESVHDYISVDDIIAGLDTNVNALNEYTRVLYLNFKKLIK